MMQKTEQKPSELTHIIGEDAEAVFDLPVDEKTKLLDPNIEEDVLKKLIEISDLVAKEKLYTNPEFAVKLIQVAMLSLGFFGFAMSFIPTESQAGTSEMWLSGTPEMWLVIRYVCLVAFVTGALLLYRKFTRVHAQGALGDGINTTMLESNLRTIAHELELDVNTDSRAAVDEIKDRAKRTLRIKKKTKNPEILFEDDSGTDPDTRLSNLTDQSDQELFTEDELFSQVKSKR